MNNESVIGIIGQLSGKKRTSWVTTAAPVGIALILGVSVPVLPGSLVLVGLLIMLLAMPVAFKLTSGSFDPWEVINVLIATYFLAFVTEPLGIRFHLAPFLPYWMGREEFERLLPAAIAYASVGILCLYAGYYSPLGPRIARALPILSPSWNGRRVKLVIVAYLAVGATAWLALIAQSGGLANYLIGLGSVNQTLMGEYYLVTLAGYLPMYAMIICYAWGRSTGLLSYELAGYFLFLVAAVPAVTSGGRSPVLWLFLCLLTVGHYIGPKRSPRRRRLVFTANCATAAVLVILVTISADLKFGRDVTFLGLPVFAAEASSDSPGASAGSFGIPSVLEGIVFRGSGVEDLGRIIERTGRVVPPAMGDTLFVASFSQLIPRAFWPEKPLSVGIRVSRLFMDNAIGDQTSEAETATGPGELYWNFYYSGVIAGMLIIGILCRVAYAYFMLNRNVSGLLVYLAALSAGLGLAGTVSSVPSVLICYLAVALTAYLLLARKSFPRVGWERL